MVFRRLLRLKYSVLLLLLFLPVWLSAANISGTVKDSTGAVIPNARIEIRGVNLAQPLIIASDGVGHFASTDLKPGTYSVRVTAEGFEQLEKSVELGSTPVTLELELSIPVAKEEITVLGKSARYANSDPVYQSLRNIGLGNAFHVEGFTVKCDAATFQLNQGTIVFLAPVNGISTGAVYIGAGHFHLKPVTSYAR